MRGIIVAAVMALFAASSALPVRAEPALQVLGRDFVFPQGMRKVAFVGQPISIYSHDDWSEKERAEAGGTTTSPERMEAAFTTGGPVNALVTDTKPFERARMFDSQCVANSERFADDFIKNGPKAMGRVLFDHTVNDWRDVFKNPAKFTDDLRSFLER